MSLTAAVRGLIVFLLSVSVVQMENGWSVSYNFQKICAPTGSAVIISCNFHYPAMIDYEENRLEKAFWFTSVIQDVETNSSFSGRVRNICGRHRCFLKIENLRKSDTDEYKFRLVTNKGQYWGRPGVDLHVTDLEVQVSRQGKVLLLECLSSCPDQTSFVWLKNKQIIEHATSRHFHPVQDFLTEEYSCALHRSGKHPSPPVYAPEPPSVSASPSAEIVEGSSVTLTCSSDANPAANYTWYKEDEDSPVASGQIFSITDVRAEHSGNYHCEALNNMGRRNSSLQLTVVTVNSASLASFIRMTLLLLLLILLLPLVLWVRRRKTTTTELNEPAEEIELNADPAHENVSTITAAETGAQETTL